MATITCQGVGDLIVGWDRAMKFEFVAGNLALDFVNTVHNHGSSDPQDDLQTYEDLMDWSRQAGLLRERKRRELQSKKPAQEKLEFAGTMKLREAVYAIFFNRARGQRVPREALQRLNWHLKHVMTGATLQSAGKQFALAWEAAVPLQRVRGEITGSAVSLLTSERLDRVRQCAGERCTWLFLDTSRNGLRRWCNMQACGNRAKVRSFRQRKAAGLPNAGV
jgi:predicted RNA-binding Zn ribbon-like protein